MYHLVKLLVRCGLAFYFRKIIFSDKKVLLQKGPLLLACNHPNSFLDAMILGAYFKQPIHFLARGDAFKNSIAAALLTKLKAIPIYRLREGKEYLSLNDETFARCSQVLQAGGIVLIFSEGLCLHEWQLRSLKKGTVRIALDVWQSPGMGQQLSILPVSFNYSSFKAFHKNVVIHFGDNVVLSDVPAAPNEAVKMKVLNEVMAQRLLSGMLVDEGDVDNIKYLLANPPAATQQQTDINIYKNKLQQLRALNINPLMNRLDEFKILPAGTAGVLKAVALLVLLALPALAGVVLNGPLYYPLQRFLTHKTRGTVFYHSALFSALIFLYLVYYILVVVFASVLVPQYWWVAISLPLWAYCTIVWTAHFISLKNANRLKADERRLLEEL